MSFSETNVPADKEFTNSETKKTGYEYSFNCFIHNDKIVWKDAIVLDVKCGNGAFAKIKEAKELAKYVGISKLITKKLLLLFHMNQPLGSDRSLLKL